MDEIENTLESVNEASSKALQRKKEQRKTGTVKHYLIGPLHKELEKTNSELKDVDKQHWAYWIEVCIK